MGMGGQRHAPAALPLGKTQYPLYWRLGGPPCGSGRVRKISPQPEFDPQAVQPVASRYTDYAIPALYLRIVHNNRLFHVIEVYGLWVSWLWISEHVPFPGTALRKVHIQIVTKCYKWYRFEYSSIGTDIYITNFFVCACSYQFFDQRY